MDGELVYTKENKKAYVVIDEEPENPREFDNDGVMVCFHKRYLLGDSGHGLDPKNFSGWDALEAYLRKWKGAKTILPLYLYDHSGLRMKVGSFSGLLPQGHAEFDSGQVGFIYSVKRGKKIEARLRAEVEEYDHYLSGQVYRFKVVEETRCDLDELHIEEVDSCGGYFSFTDAKEAAINALEAQNDAEAV